MGSFYFKFLLDDILPNNLNKSLLVISLAMIGLSIFKIITEFFRSLLLNSYVTKYRYTIITWIL